MRVLLASGRCDLLLGSDARNVACEETPTDSSSPSWAAEDDARVNAFVSEQRRLLKLRLTDRGRSHDDEKDENKTSAAENTSTLSSSHAHSSSAARVSFRSTSSSSSSSSSAPTAREPQFVGTVLHYLMILRESANHRKRYKRETFAETIQLLFEHDRNGQLLSARNHVMWLCGEIFEFIPLEIGALVAFLSGEM